jgi:hypothetical protein
MQMLKISVLDTPCNRRLVLEGKLIAPWVAELNTAFEKAGADLNGRTLVIELKNLTSISQEGENLFLRLMVSGVKFRGRGVFSKHVLKLLALRARDTLQARRETTSPGSEQNA